MLLSSQPEQIRKLHEQLLPVIHEPVGKPQQIRARRRRDDILVLQIAVVSDVQRRQRIELIGQQHVRIEILLRFQRSVFLIGEQRVVLQDQPQGQLRIELPAPF